MDREIPVAQSPLTLDSTSPSRVPSTPREFDYESDSSLPSLTDSNPEHDRDTATPGPRSDSSKASESRASKVFEVPLHIAVEIVKASPNVMILPVILEISLLLTLPPFSDFSTSSWIEMRIFGVSMGLRIEEKYSGISNLIHTHGIISFCLLSPRL